MAIVKHYCFKCHGIFSTEGSFGEATSLRNPSPKSQIASDFPALLSLVSEIAAISGIRDGHRNRKAQKLLRLRCAKEQEQPRKLNLTLEISILFNNVHTRCIVKGEAQEIYYSGDFLSYFDFLRTACSLEIPLENL